MPQHSLSLGQIISVASIVIKIQKKLCTERIILKTHVFARLCDLDKKICALRSVCNFLSHFLSFSSTLSQSIWGLILMLTGSQRQHSFLSLLSLGVLLRLRGKCKDANTVKADSCFEKHPFLSAVLNPVYCNHVIVLLFSSVNRFIKKRSLQVNSHIVIN